jgi:hypothetical protein
MMYAVILDNRVRRWGWRREGMLVHEGMHVGEDGGKDGRAVCQALSSAPRLSRFSEDVVVSFTSRDQTTTT